MANSTIASQVIQRQRVNHRQRVIRRRRVIVPDPLVRNKRIFKPNLVAEQLVLAEERADIYCL